MDKKYVILVAVIILLAGFILFDISGEILQQQKQLSFNQGAEAVTDTIATTLIQCPPTGIGIPYQNESMILHWEECLRT